MKNIFLFLLFSWCFLSFSQTNTSAIKSIELPDSTGFGTPDGKQLSKEIGTSGGTIVSDDGRVELIFPPSALTANTAISIQPTTNLAPNGVGKSYWFEPSGILFKKPVQIIFHYSDKEAEICPPDWMSLGIQSKDGKWSFVDYESFDSISKTLRGYIHHFSGASNIYDIYLRPEKSQLLVDTKGWVDMIDITNPGSGYDVGYGPGLLDRNEPVLWYANEKLNGNSQTGKIRQQTAPLGQQKVTVAEYQAPSILPKNNPVKIWAEVYRKTRKGKKLRKRLTTYIGVYDAYEISLTHVFTSRGGLGSKLVDKASCIVWVYGFDELPLNITNVKNYPPEVIKEGRRGNVTEKIYPGGTIGTIDLKAFFNYKVSKDYPPKVHFEPASVEVIAYKVQICTGGRCSEIEPETLQTIVEKINFIADGKVQNYEITIGHLDDESNIYHLTVTPHRLEREAPN